MLLALQAASRLAAGTFARALLTPHALAGTALKSARKPHGSAGGTARRAELSNRQLAKDPHELSCLKC